MPWENVAKCDVCGAVKGIANKWLLVSIGYTPHAVPAARIYHWDDTIAQDTMMRPQIVCGESCLGKLLQPFLDSRSTIPSEPAPASPEESTP
jgi:hypothetical protein